MKRLFIVNPLSERVAKKGSTLEQLKDFSAHLTYLQPFDNIFDAVDVAKNDKINHVFIEGGDGTAQGVVTEFLRQYEKFEHFPKFSILPGGMTNQVSKNIGLRSAKKRYVSSCLNTELKPIVIQLLWVSESNGPKHAGFLFSTGAIPQLTQYTTATLHGKGIGGTFAVLGGIMKAIRGNDKTLMKPSTIEIESLFDGEHLGTIATTLPSLLLGLDPFWGPQNAPLRFTYADANYQKLGRNILGLWMGRKERDRSQDGLFSSCHNLLNFDYSGPVVLDGEFLDFPSGRFTVSLSKPITFLN